MPNAQAPLIRAPMPKAIPARTTWAVTGYPAESETVPGKSQWSGTITAPDPAAARPKARCRAELRSTISPRAAATAQIVPRRLA